MLLTAATWIRKSVLWPGVIVPEIVCGEFPFPTAVTVLSKSLVTGELFAVPVKEATTTTTFSPDDGA